MCCISLRTRHNFPLSPPLPFKGLGGCKRVKTGALAEAGVMGGAPYGGNSDSVGQQHPLARQDGAMPREEGGLGVQSLRPPQDKVHGR